MHNLKIKFIDGLWRPAFMCEVCGQQIVSLPGSIAYFSIDVNDNPRNAHIVHKSCGARLEELHAAAVTKWGTMEMRQFLTASMLNSNLITEDEAENLMEGRES